jgi:hypothetical protein
MTKIAQIDLFEGDGYKGFGPLGLENGETGLAVFINFLSSAIGLVTLIGIIWFVFNMFTGAIGMITSGGDKAGLEASRKKMFSSVVGVVILISMIFIIGIFGTLLGIDFLNITQLFMALWNN